VDPHRTISSAYVSQIENRKGNIPAR